MSSIHQTPFSYAPPSAFPFTPPSPTPKKNEAKRQHSNEPFVPLKGRVSNNPEMIAKTHNCLTRSISKIRNIANKALGKFKKYDRYRQLFTKTVSVVKHSASATREILKTTRVWQKTFAGPVAEALHATKLIAVLKIPGTVIETAENVIDGLKALKVRDYEGVALNGMGFILNTVDIVDNVITFAEFFDFFANNPALEPIFDLALPINAFLCSGGTVIKGIKGVQYLGFISEMNSKVLNKYKFKDPDEINPEEFRQEVLSYLNKKVGLTDKELAKARRKYKNYAKSHTSEEVEKKIQKEINRLTKIKGNKIERRASGQAKKALRLLLKKVENEEELTQEEVQKILKIIRSVNTLSKRKLSTTIIGIGSNLMKLTAITLFVVPVTTPTPIPYLLLAGAFSLNLATLSYSIFLINHGLDFKVDFDDKPPVAPAA